MRFIYWEGMGRCFEEVMTFEEFEKLMRDDKCWGGHSLENGEHPDKDNFGYQYRPREDGEYVWQGNRGFLGWKPIDGGLKTVIEAYQKQ